MKKNSKTLIVLAVVLVIIAVAYAVILVVNDSNEKKQAAADAAATIYMCDLVDTVSLSYSNSDEAMNFTYSPETKAWSNADDPNFPLIDDNLDELSGMLLDLTAIREIEITDTLDAYGLTEPAYTLSAVDSNGSTIDLLIGAKSGDRENYYAMHRGGNKIYIIGYDILTNLKKGLYDMCSVESVPTVSTANISSIIMESDLGKLTYIQELSADGTGTWYASTGVRKVEMSDIRPALSENKDYMKYTAQEYLDVLVKFVSSGTYGGCVDYNATDAKMSEFGLDNPITITVNYTSDEGDKSIIYRLGSCFMFEEDDSTAVKEYDESYYAINHEGSKAINKLLIDDSIPIVEGFKCILAGLSA